MKNSFTIVALSLLSGLYCNQLFAQTSGDTVKKGNEFKNQGEQEDDWAKQIFTEEYKKRSFKKCKPITKISETFKYTNAVLFIPVSNEIRSIFEQGILYPDLILSAPSLPIKVGKRIVTKVKLADTTSTLSVTKAPSFMINRIDTLSITDFEELKFLENTPVQRRFRFWLFTKGFLNPTEYYIELTNKKTTANTSLEDFVKDAKVTFIETGGVII